MSWRSWELWNFCFWWKTQRAFGFFRLSHYAHFWNRENQETGRWSWLICLEIQHDVHSYQLRCWSANSDFWEKPNYDNWACSPERLSLGWETFLSHTALFAMRSWLFLEASVLSPENRYQPQILPRWKIVPWNAKCYNLDLHYYVTF